MTGAVLLAMRRQLKATARARALRRRPPGAIYRRMWNQPYLETCCRAALHRLTLAGSIGRPPALKDGPCLERLREDGLARRRPDGRYEPTDDGLVRHASEIVPERQGA